MEKVIKDEDLIGTPYEGFQIKRLVEKSTTKTTKSTIEDFQKSMEEDLPVNIKTGFTYLGENEVELCNARDDKNFISNIWGTYLQYNELGYRVRKGEKSSSVWRPASVKAVKKNGDEYHKSIRKYWKVFNIEQTDFRSTLDVEKEDSSSDYKAELNKAA
jgi:antirestriction protein ArdC